MFGRLTARELNGVPHRVCVNLPSLCFCACAKLLQINPANNARFVQFLTSAPIWVLQPMSVSSGAASALSAVGPRTFG
eukprot:1970553-Amphidinium_carterae.1